MPVIEYFGDVVGRGVVKHRVGVKAAAASGGHKHRNVRRRRRRSAGEVNSHQEQEANREVKRDAWSKG